MAQQIGQGGTITLDAFFTDGTGVAHDPTNVQVSILDTTGAVIVSLDAAVRVALGHYHYEYTVAVDAPLGAMAIQWFADINGVPVTDEDGFTVVAAGSISTGDGALGVTCEPWATHLDAPASLDAAPADEVDEAFQIAGDLLFELTRRRYPGHCHDVIRPQAQFRASDGPRTWWASMYGGAGTPWGWCSCNRDRETGCARIPAIKLPGHPVVPASIVVRLDGDTFDADSGLFRLDDHRYLVRVDGSGWPCCQWLTLDDDQPHTWSVAYDFGNRVPLGGKRSAIALGTQLFFAFNPDFEGAGACRLPKRVTSITRAGTTIAILDPLTLFKDGLTGLAEVDQWVAATNIGANRRNATVIIPGHWRSARRVGR